jgi:hypothetical protein
MNDDEKKLSYFQGWYSVVAMKSQVIIDGFNVYNQLKLVDTDHAFILPYDLRAKSLTIKNCDFRIYGSVMFATTALSFYATNVFIDTKTLLGGFVFVISCNVATDNLVNEVVIENLRMDGLRTTLFTYGGIYMTGT